MKKFYIKKASGEKEVFDFKKLFSSLKKTGASKDSIDKIIEKVKKEKFDKGKQFNTAHEIYKFAHRFLKKYDQGVAGRYSIKYALKDLGPTGYPFEKFVGQIFKELDFKIKLNQIVKGKCVSHELDVVIFNNSIPDFIECKFHNYRGIKTHLQVILYVKARLDDLNGIKKNKKYNKACIVTNTKFTKHAIDYAQCEKLKLIGWSYPKKDNLAQLIDKTKLHPITALSNLNKKQKKFLVENSIVLCKQLYKNKKMLGRLNFSKNKIDKVINEAKAICKI
ncbi:ATPase [Candidatus Dependentiae bacterium]|nr:ATPase [Candidatus Dependentiae bacterium]